jgi:Fe-S-cluster-containing dehydrogenase component
LKRIYIIEQLCNGCRQCEVFCSSLPDGVFSGQGGRIKILKLQGEEEDIPMVHCDGRCVRSIFEDGRPTCVGLCPTGALFYTEQEQAATVRREYEEARKEHSIFRFLAPWKWPFPWRRPGEDKARPAEKEIV